MRFARCRGARVVNADDVRSGCDSPVTSCAASRILRRLRPSNAGRLDCVAYPSSIGFPQIRVNGDPTEPIILIPAFMSPTQILAPRVIRFNVSYEFGRR